MTIIQLVQGDSLFRIDFTLKDANDAALNLTDSVPVFKAQLQSGTPVTFSGNMTVGTPTAGMCYYTVQANDLASAGDYYAEIEVDYTSGKIITFTDIVLRVKPQLPRSI